MNKLIMLIAFSIIGCEAGSAPNDEQVLDHCMYLHPYNVEPCFRAYQLKKACAK